MSIMAVPSKTDLYPVGKYLWTVESVDPVAVATGVFGLDMGLGEGFEGDGKELPLSSKV